MAQDELFVFPKQVEDLQEASSGLLDHGGAGGAQSGVGGHAGGVAIAKAGEAGFEAIDQVLMARKQPGVGDALVLLDETVFLEGGLMELLADLEMVA